jgi:hypothetical protein
MLSCLPGVKEVIEAARANGWTHSRVGGHDVLGKDGAPTLFLQVIPQNGWYAHPLACNYARRLGIEISPLPESAIPYRG